MAAVQDGTQRPALGLAAAVLTAAANGLAAYGASGTETPLYVLLVLAVCYALVTRHPVVAGVLAALAVMTRLDGVVVAALAGLALVVGAFRGRSTWWAPAGYTLGALVFLVPWTAWRATYYGHLLPNPLLAKSGGATGTQLARGWQYLTGFSLVHQGFLLLALGAMVALSRRRPASGKDAFARSVLWLIFVLVLGYLAFVTYVGGGWTPGWRLLAPVPPLVAVGVAATCGVLSAFSPRPSPKPRHRIAERRIVPAVVLGLCGVCLLVSVESEDMLPRMREWGSQTAELGEIGSWLGGTLPPGTVISTHGSGALSYRAGNQVIVVDMWGRTDEHIARRDGRTNANGIVASDYEYVVNVRRSVLSVATDSGYSDRQRCAIDPVYAGRYQAATFRRESTREWVTVYPRNDQAATLIAALDADPRFSYVACPS